MSEVVRRKRAACLGDQYHHGVGCREQLVRAGAFARLCARFDAALSKRGYLAKGGQIVDATIVEARGPRLTQAEKEMVKGGGIPEDWTLARTRQIDRDGRWTLKRGKKKPAPPGGSAQRTIGPAAPAIAVPMFGYKNHVGIDGEHGFVRRFTVTHAAAADGGHLAAVLDPANTASSVWADTAYRSAANIEVLERRGLKPQFQRAKPRGKPLRRPIARGGAPASAPASSTSSPSSSVGSTQKRRFNIVIRTIGKARATAKLALANLAYTFTRFLWLETRQAA